MITLPTPEIVELVRLARAPLDLDVFSHRLVRRARRLGFGQYATADTPPINTAASVFAHSTDNSSYTDMANVLSVKFSGRMRKVIERRRLGVSYVEKFTARLNEGDLTIVQEWGAAIFTTFNTFFANKTPLYLRITMDDTGGTAGSKFVCYGELSKCNPPDSMGDDTDAEFEIQLAINTVTYTAGS